jgi:hypothetical protein
MLSKVNLLTAASVMFLMTASAPAFALSVGVGGVSASVGGTSTGGVSATAGDSSTSATATVGGGDGNVANATIGNGDTTANVSISDNPGNLATVNSDGNTSTADVNLGNLGDVLGTVPGDVAVTPPNGDNPTTPVATQVSDTLSSLSPDDQDALKIRCKNVLAGPAAYTRNVVALCRLIATLK